MEANQTVSKDVKQFVVVKFGHEQFGINIKYVYNIVRMQNITRVPKASPYIKGVINLRGEIIPVMSVRIKFGLEEVAYDSNTRIIIIKQDANVIGLIVDEVREVINIADTNIETVNKEANDDKAAFVYGVGKIGNELVTLLDLEAFIN
jgi:purine-binding chemotaxis protein CheW